MIKMKCNACDGVLDNEMDVRFGTACDNHCPFCFTRNIGKKPLPFNLDKMIESTIAEGHRTCINIVGGEPLLHCNLEKLLKYVKSVRHITDTIAIITSLPYIEKEDLNIFYEIMEYVDDLIVSIQHYNPAGNNFLMKASNNYDRIAFLKELSKDPKIQAKLNVTLNLSKSGINDYNTLSKALLLFDKLKIKYVRLNELSDTPEHISLKKIVPDLKYKSLYAHGCSLNITKYFKKKLGLKNIKTIKTRLRCFIVEDTETPTWEDVIKLKLKYDNAKRCKKHNKPPKYMRSRNTVLYEDGHFELKY